MPTTRLSPDQRQQLQRDVKELALQQLSTRVIALRLGLTIARAQTIRKDLGLPARQSVTVTSKIRSRVLRLVAAFQTVGTIAEQVGIPSHVVYRIKREAGLVGRSKHSVPAEVEQTVVRLARKGQPVSAIARSVGLARSVVGRIKRQHGLTQPRR